MKLMPLRSLGLLLGVAALSAAGLASVESPAVRASNTRSLAESERKLVARAVRNSNFSTMARAAARSNCEAAKPPEALTTPNPLLDMPGLNSAVTISFIIGIDGRVQSPLILEGLGPAEDRIVLETVRTWRFRPATCNGVPTEAEGKIAFSSR
jgi:outer membrane biosynthesis protein TonB